MLEPQPVGQPRKLVDIRGLVQRAYDEMLIDYGTYAQHSRDRRHDQVADQDLRIVQYRFRIQATEAAPYKQASQNDNWNRDAARKTEDIIQDRVARDYIEESEAARTAEADDQADYKDEHGNAETQPDRPERFIAPHEQHPDGDEHHVDEFSDENNYIPRRVVPDDVQGQRDETGKHYRVERYRRNPKLQRRQFRVGERGKEKEPHPRTPSGKFHVRNRLVASIMLSRPAAQRPCLSSPTGSPRVRSGRTRRF